MTVLMVALMAMSASTLQSHSLRRQNRERAVAQNAVRQISEEIHALSDRIRRQESSWSQAVVAALSAGGELGDRFAVRELTPAPGEPSVGTIRLVLDETLSDADLQVELGMPRDLDGDGAAASGDVTSSAMILPVVVTARWTGVSGEVRIRHPFFIIGY